MSIDVFIFDLFGVLISFDDDLVYRRIAQHCARPRAAFAAMRGLVSRHELIVGRLTLEQLRDELIAEHGLTLGSRELEAAWLTPYSAPMPGMAALIRALAASHPLVLLSNVDRYYWEVVRRSHPELELFSERLLSWELGIAKPDRSMFSRAIEAARTSPARCLFVDDKLENIEAAREVGLPGHLFVGADDLRAAIDRRSYA